MRQSSWTLRAAHLILEFKRGMDKTAFLKDLKHGYDIVDLDEVWKTADTDVPDLLSLLEPLLPRTETS